MKTISLTCEEDQLRWLSEHPEVNRSGAFRALISYMMKTDRTVLSNADLQNISGKIR